MRDKEPRPRKIFAPVMIALGGYLLFLAFSMNGASIGTTGMAKVCMYAYLSGGCICIIVGIVLMMV
jgi:hypothetical protein